MNPRYIKLADQLGDCFSPMNEAVTAEILARMCADEHFAATYRFEFSAETLRQLIGILALDETLALDFRDAVWANRQSPQGADLMQQVIAIGRCQVQRERLDLALPQVLSPVLRQRFARYLNELDGELATRREAFAHGGLARRINRAAGTPIVDGVQLHGMVHVLAAHPPVWEAFRSLVAESIPTQPDTVAIAPDQWKK